MELEDSARERSARAKTMAAIAVGAALTVISGLVVAQFRSRSPSARPLMAPSSVGPSVEYFLRFPEKAESPSLDADNGGASLVIETNLPDGTRIFMTQEEHPGTEGVSCCPQIERGRFVVEEAFNSSCYAPQGGPQSTGFTISIEVRHSYEDLGLWDFGVQVEGERDLSHARQPRHVLAVLGEKFERLVGEQVVSQDGVSKLVASRTYEWPPNTCAPVRAQNVPDECDYGGQLQADDPEGAMMWFIAAISQGRLCEIYAEQLTPELRQAQPWNEFMKRWQDWIEGLGSLVSDKPSRTSALTYELTEETGTRYAVEVFLHDRLVARAELLSLPHPPGSPPEATPYWGFSGIDLL